MEARTYTCPPRTPPLPLCTLFSKCLPPRTPQGPCRGIPKGGGSNFHAKKKLKRGYLNKGSGGQHGAAYPDLAKFGAVQVRRRSHQCAPTVWSDSFKQRNIIAHPPKKRTIMDTQKTKKKNWRLH